MGAAGNLLGAKLLALSDLCKQADNTRVMQDPMNYPLMTALHDLWDTANRSKGDLMKTQATPLIWIVPSTMSMSSIAISLYGDSTKQSELLQLNAVEDVFAVRAGTTIRYVVSKARVPGTSFTVAGTS